MNIEYRYMEPQHTSSFPAFAARAAFAAFAVYILYLHMLLLFFTINVFPIF